MENGWWKQQPAATPPLCARTTAVRRVLGRDVGGRRRRLGRPSLVRQISARSRLLNPSHARVRRLSYLAHFFLPWGPLLPLTSFLALLRPSQPLRSLPSVPAGMSSSNRSDEAARSARAVRTRTPSESLRPLRLRPRQGRGGVPCDRLNMARAKAQQVDPSSLPSQPAASSDRLLCSLGRCMTFVGRHGRSACVTLPYPNSAL